MVQPTPPFLHCSTASFRVYQSRSPACVAPPSSALRAPSPIKGEGDRAESLQSAPSPLMGEGGRRPDEGGATHTRGGGTKLSNKRTSSSVDDPRIKSGDG